MSDAILMMQVVLERAWAGRRAAGMFVLELAAFSFLVVLFVALVVAYGTLGR